MEVKFEYRNPTFPCQLTGRWGGCCCTCKYHAKVLKHCVNSPHESGQCVCSESLGFYVCLVFHSIDGSGVHLSSDHGICEMHTPVPDSRGDTGFKMSSNDFIRPALSET